MIWPGFASFIIRAPSATIDSLLASAMRLPARRAERVGSRPARPLIALTTISHFFAASADGVVFCFAKRLFIEARGSLRFLELSSSVVHFTLNLRACCFSSFSFVCALKPRTFNPLPIMSSVCWPIEPVDPSIMMVFMLLLGP